MHRRMITILAALLSALALALGLAQRASAQMFTPFIHSNVSGGNTGYCVDDPNNTTANGTQQQLWQCNDFPQQLWFAETSSFSTGYFKIVLQNGKCLDVRNDTPANGTPVQIWTCLNNASQAWAPEVVNSKFLVWINANGYCLDDTGDRNVNGNKLQIWQCFQPNNSQAWEGPE